MSKIKNDRISKCINRNLIGRGVRTLLGVGGKVLPFLSIAPQVLPAIATEFSSENKGLSEMQKLMIMLNQAAGEPEGKLPFKAEDMAI